LISTHQNDLKTPKIYYFEAKKLKKLIFFKNTFETQKQIGKTPIQHTKTCSISRKGDLKLEIKSHHITFCFVVRLSIHCPILQLPLPINVMVRG